ncbi:MAG: LamG-like jellyroll fold domain-containing protein [Patescibacteria group bacterium]
MFLVFIGAFVTWQSFAAGTTYTWTNSGGDGLWTNSNNWSPVGTPGTGDLVVFNGTATADCSIDANVNLNSFTISSGYTGTITRESGYTFSLSGTFSQSNGVFNGGLGNISFASTFTLSGGTFNASQGTTYFDSNFTHTGGIFDGGIGTAHFRGINTTFNIAASSGNTVTFNNFILNQNDTSYYLTISSADKLIVNGTTTLRRGYLYGGDANSNLEARGDVVIESTHNYSYGRNSFRLNIAGTGPQTVNIASATYIPRLIFSGVSTTVYGPEAAAYAYTFETISGNTHYIGQGGQLQMSGPSLQSGGNLTTTNTNWYFGSSYTHSNGTSTFGVGNVIFYSTFTLSGGTFTASETNTYFDSNFTHTGGIFDGGIGTAHFRGINTTFNIAASSGNTVTFNNFILNQNDTSYYLTISSADKLIVNGTTTLRRGYLYGGDANSNLEARGDVVIESTHNYSYGRNSFRLNIAGTGPQTVNIASATYIPRLIFSGVSTTVYGPEAAAYAYTFETISGNTHYIGQGGQLQMSGPSLQSGGNLTTTNTNWYFGSTYTHSNGISTFGLGNITFASTFTLSGGIFNAPEGNIYFSNVFTLSGGTFYSSEGNAYFYHNFTHTGGVFDGGSGTVHFAGSTVDQNINVVATTGNSVTFNNFVLNKSYASYYLRIDDNDRIVVTGTTTLKNVGWLYGGNTYSALEARGDVVVESTYITPSARNTVQLLLAGTGSQTLSIAGGTYLPRLVFAGASTTVYGPSATTYAYTIETTAGNTHYIGQGGQLQFSTASFQSGGNLSTTNTNWNFAGSYTHSNGTATFGSHNLYFNSLFTLSGGIFNAPQGNAYFYNNFTHTGGVFGGGSGTVHFVGSTVDQNINVVATTGNSVTFNNFVLNKSYAGYHLRIDDNDRIVVTGTTTLKNIGWLYGGNTYSALEARGDVVVESTYITPSARNIVQLLLAGTGSQTLSIAGGTYLPRLVFAGASTTVYGPSATTYAYTIETTAGNTHYIGQGGQLQFSTASFQSGGNLSTTNTNWNFAGSYTHSNGTATFGSHNLYFNSLFTLSGGIFNAPQGNAYFYNNFTHTGGIFDPGIGTVDFRGSSYTTLDVVSSINFYNFKLNKSSNSYYLQIAGSDTVNIYGDTLISKGYIYGDNTVSNLNLRGNLEITDGFIQPLITFSGDNEQNINLNTVVSSLDGEIRINKTGGSLLLLSDLTMDNSKNLLLNSGTFDLSDKSLRVTGSGSTFIVANDARLRLMSGATYSFNTGYPQFANNSIVEYYRTNTGTYNILSASSVGNMIINGIEGSIFRLNNSSLTVNGYLQINEDGTLFLNSNTLILSSPTNFFNEGTLDVAGNEYTNLVNDTDSGTVSYVGNNDGLATFYDTLFPYYYNLKINFTDGDDIFNTVGDMNDNLIAYWSMDEGNGTTVYDQSGNGMNGVFGTGGSAPTWTSGKSGSAVSFDGSDFVNFGASNYFCTANFSVEFWMKAGTQANDYPTLIEKFGPDYGLAGWAIGLKEKTAKTITYTVGDNSGGWGVGYYSLIKGVVTDNNWHHMVGTYDGRYMSLYIDGVLAGSYTWSKYTCASSNLYFGYSAYSSARAYKGVLDEVKIYNKAIKAEDVKKLAGNLKSGLLSYWNMDEGSGNTINDLSGNGRHGTLGAGSLAPTWVAGKNNFGLSFDGVDDYVSASHGELDKTFSVSAWINYSNLSNTQVPIAGGSVYDYFFSNIGGTLYNSLRDASSNQITCNTNLTTGWHHYTSTINVTGSNVDWKIYRDGILVEQCLSSTGLTPFSLTRLGSRIDGQYYFSGILDDVAFYYRVLPVSEISDLVSVNPLYEATDSFSIYNNLEGSNGNFIAPSTTLYVGGNILMLSPGIFDANSGLVILNGEVQTIGGFIVFNDLTKTVTSSQILYVTAGSDIKIEGSANLSGIPNNLLSLHSTVSGTQANIDFAGARAVEFLDVKDIVNFNSSAVLCINGCVDSGNNINFTFVTAPPHYEVRKSGASSASVTAGEDLVISIFLIDEFGSVSSTYNGNYDIIFYGANNSPYSDRPTAKDIFENNRNFGSTTTLNFINGEATTTLKLYKNETVQIDVSGNNFNTSGSNDYALIVTVGSQILNEFILSSSANVISGIPFTIDSISKDAFGNITNYVNSDTQVSVTSTVDTFASISPTIVSSSEFTDDGLAETYFTINNVTNLETLRIDYYNDYDGNITTSSVFLSAVGIPTAPSGVAASYFALNSFRITWSDTSGGVASGFVVERDTDTGSGFGNNWVAIATTTQATNSFIDNVANNIIDPPQSNERYKYRVRSFNSVGYSVSYGSDPVAHYTVPGTPSNLLATYNSSPLKFDLTFTDNSAVSDYFSLDRCVGISCASNIFSSVSSSLYGTSTLDTSLSGNSRYRYRVKAIVPPDAPATEIINVSSTFAYSAYEYTAPATPSDLKFYQVSSNQWFLSWKDNSTYENGFEIQVSYDGGSNFEPVISGATVGQNVKTYLFSSPTSQNDLQFKVRAYISATDNNSELYSGDSAGSQVLSTDFHYEIKGNSSQIAGNSQTISIILKDLNGNTSTFWSGDKELFFSGASSSVNGIVPTCSDKNNSPIVFGNTTTITFTNGVASCNLILYRAENAVLEVTDNFYSTNADNSYSLGVTVVGNSLNRFLIDAPATINYNSSTMITVYALDTYYNNTLSVSGNTNLSLYVNSVLTGTINPAIISATNFTDDGIWAGNITVTDIYENPTVVITAVNGSANGSDSFLFNGRPNTPGSVAVSYISDNEFEITWQDRSTIETGYLVQKKTDTGSGLPGTWVTIATLSTNTQSFVDNATNNPLDAPQADRRYMYQIIASGSIVSSYGASDNLIHYTTPDYPTNFYATYVNDNRFNLYFTDNANVINTHVFSRCDSAGCDSSTFNFLGKSSSSPYADTASLLANNRYKYVSHSETPSPESLISSDVYSAYEFTSPAAPSAFYASEATSNTISFVWTDNALYESGYLLEYAVASSSVFTPIYNNGITTVGADMTGFSFASSTPDNAYRFKMRSAISATVRNGALYSSYVGGTEYVYTQPNKPINQAAIFSTSTVISLSWDDDSNYEDGFRIEVSINGGGWSEITTSTNTVGANITTYDLVDVDLNNDYQFRVRSHIAGNTFAPEVFSEYTEVFSPQSYHFEFSPLNDITTTAGTTTTVTLALKDSGGNIVSDYNGEKNVYFSGASSSITGVEPTVINFNGEQIDFGSITSINFINGEAEINMFLPAVGSYNIDADTLAYSTAENNSYQLRVSVDPASVDSFTISSQQSTVTSTIPFTLSVTAFDEYLNTTTAVLGNTYISSSIGDISPVGIAEADFTDDGIWEGSVTLSNINDRNTVYLYVNNGSANGEIYLTVIGIPNKPSGVASSLNSDEEGSYFSIGWSDNSVVETGYEIQKCVLASSGASCAEGDWSLATTTSANIHNTRDYSVSLDSKIKYRVRGFNSIGYSDWATEVNYHFTKPDAPINVYAKRISSSQFSVYYTSQTGITNEHRIFRSDYYFTSNESNSFYSVSSPYSDTYQITTNNRFLYNVKAKTSDGIYSDDSYSIYEYTTPVAPSSVISAIVNETQVQISWVDNSLFESGFRIEESINSGSWNEIDSGNDQTGQNIRTYLHTVSSTSSNTYKYRVRAHIGETANNSELFSSYSNEAIAEISDLHFEIYAPATTTAGVVTALQIALRDVNGNNASYFTGNRILKFISDGTQPTLYCSDKDGNNIMFGENTTVSFINGAATCSTTLYNAVTTTIDVYDDSFSSTSSPAYDLDLKVEPNVARKFSVSAPTQAVSTVPSTVRLIAQDFWNNTTTLIFNTTTVSVSTGSVSPLQILDSSFENGIATISLVISSIIERPAVNVEFRGFDSYSSTTIYGNAYITVLGVPNAPTSVSSVRNSNESITLSWSDNSTIESGYAIERQVDEGSGFGSWIFVAQVNTNIHSYTDYSTVANRRYKYRVRTIGSFANSDYAEDPINSLGGIYTTPTAPTFISPVRYSDNRFDITFVDNALVTNYFDLKRCDGAACSTNSFSAITTTPILLIPSQTVTGTINYTDNLNIDVNNRYRYAFTVKPPASSGSTVSAVAYSNYEYTKPAAPSGVNAIKTEENIIYIYWDDNSSYEDGFRIEYSDDSAEHFTEVTPGTNTVGANVESYNFTIPSTTLTYLFRIKSHVPATASNVELLSDFDQTQTSETHLVVTGSNTQNVGESQTITLTIRDGENNIITDYDGDKSIILTGPSNSLTGVQATCTNKSGNPVNIGLITTINFVDGVGQCNFTPYRAETVLLRATDGLHTSYTHPSYNLNLTAVAGTLNNFLVAIPATSSIDLAFETIIYARDIYNNITKQVSGNTSLTASVGSLSVNSIAQSDFTDDGIWYGNLSINNLYDLNNVILTAQNSGASGYDSIEIIAAPNLPLNVLASYISDNQINISWTDNSSAEDYYVVEKRSDTTGSGFGSWTTLATTSPNAVILSDINTAGNKRYEYRVYSGNIYGNSDYVYSNVVYTSLPAPVITTSTVLSANSMVWDWTSSALFSTEFRLHFTSSNHLDYININSSSDSFTVNDLTPNTGYQIVLYTWRSDRGYSPASNTSTLLYTFAALPTDIQVSTNTDETLTLNWNQNSNPSSTEYKVKNITTGDESEWITNNSWTDNNLDCETSYDYIIKARNHDNVETDWTVTSTLETGLCVMPSIPNSFSAEYISDSQIDLSWLSTDIYSKSFVIEKRVNYGSGFNSWSVLATTTNANSSLSDTVVSVNSAYEYRIRGVNKIGESENLASAVIYTGLLAPTINTPSAILDNSITFNWINNSNFAEEFVLEFVEGEHEDIENINVTNTSFIVEDLLPNTIYSVKVYAANSSRGRSEASATSTAVYTLAEIPDLITATSTTQNSMTLNWSAGDNPSGTEYYIEEINSTTTNSGWTTTTVWNISNLSCGVNYSFRIKTRNFENVESGWSANNSFSTESCPSFGGDGSSSFNYVRPSTDNLGIKINNGALYTNNKNVQLNLSAGNDVSDMAIANDISFDQIPQESFAEVKDWILSGGDGLKKVYVRFFGRVGGLSSETYFNSIILDTTPPSISFTDYKSSYSIHEKIKISGLTEANSLIFVKIDGAGEKQISADNEGKWNLDLNYLPFGKYSLIVKAKDQAQNLGKENSLIVNVDNENIINDEEKENEEDFIEEEKNTEETDLWLKAKELGVEILGEITDLPLIKDIVDKISDWLKEPETETVNIPLVDAVPQITPIAFEIRWNLFPVKKFILAPLPNEVRLLAEKFPEFSTTLTETGVARMTDMIKMKNINFVLPSLSSTILNRVAEINIPVISSTGSVKYGDIKITNLENSSSSFNIDLDPSKLDTGEFFSYSLPLAKLSEEEKKQIPTEIMFVKNALADLDLNTKVAINENGRPIQKINTISGTTVELIVKPQAKVNSVKGYVVYKNSGIVQAKSAVTAGSNLNKILSDIFAGEAVFAETAEKEIPVEERLVLKEFEYTDPDSDGIYTAFVDIPVKDGEYEIITVFDYIDSELGRKQIRLLTVVDPEGYVYEKVGEKEMRVKGSVVSLYRKNETSGEFELWNATKYQQINPQTVGVTGDYSFLVTPGEYYLEAKAKGYKNYRGEYFTVDINDAIFENIQLYPAATWKKYLDWKTVLPIAFSLFLLYYYNHKNKKIKT